MSLTVTFNGAYDMTITLPLWLVFICSILMFIGFVTFSFFALIFVASRSDKQFNPKNIPAHWM